MGGDYGPKGASIPGGADGHVAGLLKGPKYSPNLAKWIKREGRLPVSLEVYRDPNGVLWLGWIDDGKWFIGQRLWRILTVGLRDDAGCWTFPVSDLTPVAGFWAAYARDGRCAIDTEHSHGFIGDDARWLTDGDERSCTWCGHRQSRRRWTERVRRESWTPHPITAGNEGASLSKPK